MKKVVLILSCILAFSGLMAQDEDAEIGRMLKAGDISGLASHFQSQVDMSLFGSEAMYSRTQAEMVLARLFKGDPPIDFVIQHVGQSKQESRYTVGQLSTASHKYRLTYLLSTEGDRLLIKQLRIEKAG